MESLYEEKNRQSKDDDNEIVTKFLFTDLLKNFVKQ